MPDLVVICLWLIPNYSVVMLDIPWHRSFWADNVLLILLCLFSTFYGFALCLAFRSSPLLELSRNRFVRVSRIFFLTNSLSLLFFGLLWHRVGAYQ